MIFFFRGISDYRLHIFAGLDLVVPEYVLHGDRMRSGKNPFCRELLYSIGKSQYFGELFGKALFFGLREPEPCQGSDMFYVFF